MEKLKIKGFTLIELLVVIAIIAMLASVILASLSTARAKARDARRLADMRTLQTALEMYYNTYGKYPSPNVGTSTGANNTKCTGGWEGSDGDNFLKGLVDGGFLPTNIKDPLDVTGVCGNYMYYNYPKGYLGCAKSFYVLKITNLETVTGVSPLSPRFSCGTYIASGEWATGSLD